MYFVVLLTRAHDQETNARSNEEITMMHLNTVI